MKDCPEFADMLPACAEAGLDKDGKLSLERHLARCASCAAQLEDLQRVESACAAMRGAVADASGITKLMEAVMNTANTTAPRLRAASILRSIFSRRWLPPVAAAAAAAIVLAVFFFPGLRGVAGLTWAEVQESVGVSAWIHYTTTDVATGEVTGESWYSPTARRAYTRLARTDLPYYVLVDYASKEQWLYDSAERSLTIHQLQPGQPEGDFLQAVLDPARFPEWPRRVVKAESSSGLTRFDVFIAAEGAPSDNPVMSIWVDDKTKLPARAETHHKNSNDKTVHSVVAIDYPAKGPADVYALGVPRDVKLLDARPTGDLARVMLAYKGRRDGFATEYRATLLADGDSDFSYAVSRDGDKWRVEEYFPSAVGRNAVTGRPALAPGASCCAAIVCDGVRTVEYSSEREPRASLGRGEALPHTLRTGADPAYASWPEIPLQPLKMVTGEGALTGLIGVELRGGPAGTLDHYWLDPQHDYICRLYTRHETKGGQEKLTDKTEVLEFAQLADGRWYARTKAVSGEAGGRKIYIDIDQYPQFAAGTFDSSANPWASVRVTAVDASRTPLSGVGLAPLDAGWEPHVSEKEGALVVTNLQAGQSADVVLTDNARGLAARVPLVPQADGEAPVEAVLAQGIHLTGLVKDASGAAVPGAAVILSMRQQASGGVPKGWGLAGAKTDAEGRYEFGILLPGFEYRVQLYSNSLEGRQQAVTLDAAKGTAAVADTVMAPRTKCLAGRVTDKVTGAPVAGIIVNWFIDLPASYAKDGTWDTWCSDSPWQVETDSDGRWHTDLTSSHYTYRAFVGDSRYEPASVDGVDAGRTDVDFQLTPAPTVPESPKQ